MNDWQSIIRNSPYYLSQDMTDNVSVIRRWVLFSEGYCEVPDRHVLFDRRGRFLSWMSNLATEPETQQKLNRRREQLFAEGKVEQWLPGSHVAVGYPFALACDQPHVNVAAALSRLFGDTPSERIWGTWDGMTAGSERSPITLADVVFLVWQQRQKNLSQPLKALDFELFLAQLVIESGAVKNAHSQDDAIGILQLRHQALQDCGIAKRFYRHRMAQVDCAVRLYVLNRRNLEPAFMARFGHLQEPKRKRLFSLLLVQTYHSGIGNMLKLLGEEAQGEAAKYFAEHQADYSAEDIALGLLFHNLGREPWGWNSLYYVTDILLVESLICQRNDGCKEEG
ncbi:MAG: hypothetical protein P8X89_08885 [Reinekea sp.]